MKKINGNHGFHGWVWKAPDGFYFSNTFVTCTGFPANVSKQQCIRIARYHKLTIGKPVKIIFTEVK